MRINEITNPDIHHTEFKHSQEIGDFLYKAEADNDSGYGTTLVITAYDGKKEIAQAEFIMDEDADSLTSANTWVLPEYQELGIATTMYAYAKMLGNDVTPSRIQTDQGNRMWRSWNQKKQSKHILPRGHKGYHANESLNNLTEILTDSVSSQVLYHGSQHPIANFTIPPYGVFFSPHPEWAEHYGSVITAAKVNAAKVYVVDYKNSLDEKIVDALFDRDYTTLAEIVKLLQSKGYQALQTISDSEMVCVFPGTSIKIIDNN